MFTLFLGVNSSSSDTGNDEASNEFDGDVTEQSNANPAITMVVDISFPKVTKIALF